MLILFLNIKQAQLAKISISLAANSRKRERNRWLTLAALR